MSRDSRPATGFVLGKFMPPHLGHVFMCDFARAYCKRLTILVCSLADDPVPGARRFQWMKKLFPDCDVQWCREDLPQAPQDHPDFWPIWRDVVTRYAGAPEVVFASEDYGARLAQETGARFVPVDRARLAVPVSGTMIRNDPFRYWDFLPVPVRAYYAKRVCLFGPESTGKSTLAVALAKRFNTVHVPEYARTFTNAFGTKVTVADLELIAEGQRASLTAARFQANRILIEDTDRLLTAVWSDMLLGWCPPSIGLIDDPPDLYLLCDIDLPWDDDGTRYFPALADRQRFFDACRAELESWGVPYAVIRGTGPAREDAAAAAIKAAFPSLEG